MKRGAALACVLLLAPACRAPAPGARGEWHEERARSAAEVARARLAAPAGLALFRARALPLPGEAAPAGWNAILDGLVPGARGEPPLFAALSDPEETDLFRPNQAAFAREAYLLRVAPSSGGGPTFVVELVVSPVPADAGRLPSP